MIFNEKHFSEVWIDPHYEEKHGSVISDSLILSLVAELWRCPHKSEAHSNGFHFFKVDQEYRGKLYRLILVTPSDESYLGVRNAYRRSK